MEIKDLFEKIKKGDRRALAKGITLVESSKREDRKNAQELLRLILPLIGNSQRIGISGIPGVGKSSFIEVLGKQLISKGKKVAVLAVDPTSPVSGGSILGDKTRMEELSQDESAFIRPSPTAGSIGGVGQKTRETMYLCEAAGYDTILVETVGVGQSEYEVSSMVDLFMVLMVPNAGDELQGIKKGIIELADMLVINKADGDTKTLAENAKTQYENALHIIKKENLWDPKVLTCSSLEKTGFDVILSSLDKYFVTFSKNNALTIKRNKQNANWLKTLFSSMLKEYVSNDETLSQKFTAIEAKVLDSKATPQEAAEQMIKLILKD
ncbi:MAG: methylmalonyl Co-A mutase-associated GTPase MeaB [Halobacteriovoraceae bacterium]|nr:methylmalonyl Co-A mutase-associated GTPase MeaB [Halobacteriovoraceae bacterium]